MTVYLQHPAPCTDPDRQRIPRSEATLTPDGFICPTCNSPLTSTATSVQRPPCGNCQGTGTIPAPELRARITCPYCAGTRQEPR